MQRKYQNVGEDPSMKTVMEIESDSTNYMKNWCLHREKIPFKTKGFFKGGMSFQFRSPYLSTAESNFHCLRVDALILWYSKARAFPQVRNGEGCLTKKKKNYRWLLASCNNLFFIFQFMCNILDYIPETKRQKKYVQISVWFFFSFWTSC